jgi:Sec-independent protein translocase protein TatA
MWEVVLILVVALVVLGPRQLTEVAKALGKLYREVQKLASDVRSSVDLDALTRIDDPPDKSRQNYEPPPAVKDQELVAPPGERSGPDFYADLLESSKEPDDKPEETKDESAVPTHVEPGEAPPPVVSTELKSEPKKADAPEEKKSS